MADHRGARVRVDPEEEFQYWAALPLDERSYGAVSARFGNSARTVERHARDGKWRERLRAIEAEAAARSDQRLGRRRAQQLATFHELIEASCMAYARRLASGDMRVTTSEFVGLIKVALVLHGEPADRVEVLGGSEEWATLRTRILEAIDPFPEARLALAEALEEADNEQTGG